MRFRKRARLEQAWLDSFRLFPIRLSRERPKHLSLLTLRQLAGRFPSLTLFFHKEPPTVLVLLPAGSLTLPLRAQYRPFRRRFANSPKHILLPTWTMRPQPNRPRSPKQWVLLPCRRRQFLSQCWRWR